MLTLSQVSFLLTHSMPISLPVSPRASNGMQQILFHLPFNYPRFKANSSTAKDNSVYQGFVTAIYEIGCLLGAIFVLAYGDRTGRRKAVRTTS